VHATHAQATKRNQSRLGLETLIPRPGTACRDMHTDAKEHRRRRARVGGQPKSFAIGLLFFWYPGIQNLSKAVVNRNSVSFQWRYSSVTACKERAFFVGTGNTISTEQQRLFN
jgi:hypothetical protein